MDLRTLHTLLHTFADASGLQTNVEKCQATPISCTEADVQRVLDLFPCTLAPFPCKYLASRSPSTASPGRRADLERAEAFSIVVAGTLLTKVTLSAVPVHVSIVCCLSAWAREEIDQRRRAFIWCGSDSASGGSCMVAWEHVCRRLQLGGLSWASP